MVKRPVSPIGQSSPCTQELVRQLQEHASMHLFKPGEKLNFIYSGEDVCYLIINGITVFHREHDDIALRTVTTPAFLGLGNNSASAMPGYLKTMTSCKIGIISKSRAYEIIKEKNLWEMLALHMIVVSNKLFTINEQISKPTAYEIILQQLPELINEGAEITGNITAAKYIHNKTRLSRSRIMTILSDLKAGGFIEIEAGKLIKIHHLPKKY